MILATQYIAHLRPSRPGVVEAAILNGANHINDLWDLIGGRAGNSISRSLKRKMKRLAKKYAVPAVLIHSLGDTARNHGYGQYSYAREAVVEEVRRPLTTNAKCWGNVV